MLYCELLKFEFMKWFKTLSQFGDYTRFCDFNLLFTTYPSLLCDSLRLTDNLVDMVDDMTSKLLALTEDQMIL